MLFVWYGYVLGQLSKHLVIPVGRERESRFEEKHASISFHKCSQATPKYHWLTTTKLYLTGACIHPS